MNNNLAENLKKIRKDNNMSQEQLAEELKVSRQAISKWESGIAYPEMEKILQICNRFELNINDLLNSDIREVKKEEESKNSINKYIDDFLKFITNTIDMFSTMNFKSKIKCIFEQLIIIGVLALIASIIGSIFSGIFNDIFSHGIPYNAYQVLHGVFKSIYLIFIIIVIAIVLIHIFKTRYLDYYNNLKTTTLTDEEKTDEQVVDKKEISKKKEERIVIRDPRHSEYRFINGILKFIVGCIKCFVFLLFLSLGFMLIGFMVSFVCAFLICKTGLLFIGLLVSILGASIITITFEFIFLNFIFNRKSNKKKIIWAFIISFIMTGIGAGMMFLGTLNFSVIPYDETNLLKQDVIEVDMQNNMVINNNIYEIEFIEEDRNNLKIEYSLNKYSELGYGIHEDSGYKELTIYDTQIDMFEMVRGYLTYVNDKKIINLDNEIFNIKIYTSKENISKLKNNYDEYTKKQQEEINYQNQILELTEELETCKEQIIIEE